MFTFRLMRSFTEDQVWGKITNFSLILFFTFLGDAILSFWVPNLLESALGSPLLMGLVLSFSSIIGLVADLILPSLFKHFSVKNLLTVGIFASFIFSILLIVLLKFPLLALFLLAMAVWGLYYEFLGFGTQEFVANAVPLRLRSSSWAFLSVFRSLAYFLGPILGGWFLIKGDYFPAIFAITFSFFGFSILIFTTKSHHREPLDFKAIHPFSEAKHWRALAKSVWPMMVMSLMMGLIDAFFWSIGALWTEALKEQNLIGGFFLSMYTLPSLFMGFAVVHWGIFQGKKKLAEKFLILSGLLLTLLYLSTNVFWQLFIVFVASLALSVVYPLVDAVYTDIVVRMGKEKKHLIGLTNSIISLAYILGPTLAGLAAKIVGEQSSFVILGATTSLVSLFLLFVTPKKLKLPQAEIQTWS